MLLIFYVEKLTSVLKHALYSQKIFREYMLLVDCNTPKCSTNTISWIFQHAKNMEILLNESACKLLFSYYENDFNALHHMLYQLSIIYPKKTLSCTHIKQFINDASSNFHISHLLNALLIGDHKKSSRILKKIKTDNITKPVIILYAIQNIISNLIIFKRRMPNTTRELTLLLNKYKIPEIFRSAFIVAFQRLNLRQLYQIITLTFQIEISIQNSSQNTIWHNFKLLILLFKDRK